MGKNSAHEIEDTNETQLKKIKTNKSNKKRKSMATIESRPSLTLDIMGRSVLGGFSYTGREN